MKNLVTICLSVFSLTAVRPQSPTTSWQMIGGNPERSSMASMALTLPLKVVDTLDLNYRSENGTTLWDGKLFIADYATDSNTVWAFDAESGDSLWNFKIPYSGGGMSFIPAVSQGVVLAGGQGGKGLYALEAYTGDSLWFLPVGGLYTRSPLVVDSLVYLCAYDSLICVHINTGNILWSNHGYTRQISPAADSTNIYACGATLVYAADRFTGDTIWSTDSVIAADFLSLMVDSVHLYTAARNKIFAVDKFTGQMVWQVQLNNDQVVVDFPSGLAMTSKYILAKYIETGMVNSQFILMDKSTGTILKHFEGVNLSYQAPTIISHYVIDFADGYLKLLELETGDIAFEMSGLPVAYYPAQIIAAKDKIYIAGLGPNVLVLSGQTSALEEKNNLMPENFVVSPNPMEDHVEIGFSLVKAATVTAFITSTGGMVCLKKALGRMAAGDHSMKMDCRRLMPGSYFVQLQTEHGSASRLVIKP